MHVRAVAIALSVAAAALSSDVVPRDDRSPESKELQQRVTDYIKLRKEAVARLPKLNDKSEPEQIHAHKLAEAEAIRAARAGAKQGDVLTPDVQRHLTGLIHNEMKGKSGKAAKRTAKAGNPAAEGPTSPIRLQVNAVYPDSAPLSAVPPTLLLRLPELPKQVDFRFVGRSLVLRDVGSGLILDYIPNAMPPE